MFEAAGLLGPPPLPAQVGFTDYCKITRNEKSLKKLNINS